MTTDQLTIGIVSFAHPHALSYARALGQRADVRLVATDPGPYAPGEDRGAELAESAAIPYVDTVDELYAEGLDGVIICTENARHRPFVEQAAAAGVPVLCEKPLATTVADAEAMVAACERAGVALMVAFPVRFSPAFAALREALAAGAVGELRALTGTNNGQLPAGRGWFADPELAGGGALTDHVVHIADLVDALTDGTPAASVYAQSNNLLHPTAAVETAGLVSVRYANGLLLTIDCSWSKPADYPTWGGLTLQAVGEAGIADLDAFGERVDGFAGGRQTWLSYGADADAVLLDAFLAGIRDRTAPQPDGHVGVRTARIVAAAYESARSGQPVELG